MPFYRGVILPRDLSEFSEYESTSRNFKLPFHWEICHLICLSSQSGNLSVGISNCHFWEVDLPPDLPLDLPELSEWESISMNLKLPFYGRVDLPTIGLPNMSSSQLDPR